MMDTSFQNNSLLAKERKGDSRFKKALQFAICAMVETRCWVRTGQGIWETSMVISKASAMSIGVTKERRCWCRTFILGMISINNAQSKNLGLPSREINLRTLFALDVKNTSANGISLNWKMSRQEVSNSVGYVLLVRTGCARGISSLSRRKLQSIKRIKEICKIKSICLSLQNVDNYF
jgi:hypothetical protein